MRYRVIVCQGQQVPRRRKADRIRMTCGEFLGLLFTLLGKDGACSIKHMPAWLDRRPERIDDAALQSRCFGDISRAPQPSYVGMAAHYARCRARHISQHGRSEEHTSELQSLMRNS